MDALAIDLGGVIVPRLFYGTAWKEETTAKFVEAAIGAGFRAIDTANQRKHYHEAGVGEGIARAGVERDALFLQTKFTSRSGQDDRLPYDPRARVAEQVVQSFDRSCEHLRTDRIDSLVLHGPTVRQGLADADWEAWQAMETLRDAGRVRFLGISNVSSDQLEELCSFSRVKPNFVQNRCYAELSWDAKTRAVAKNRGVVYQGFSLLTANREALRSAKVRAIAARLGRDVSSIAFRFAIDLGMIALTGTTDVAHMKDDLAIGDVELTDADRDVLARAAFD